MIEQTGNSPGQESKPASAEPETGPQEASTPEAAEITTKDILPAGFDADVSTDAVPDQGLEPDRAALRLEAGLEQLRAANGRMCKFIDSIANPDSRLEKGEISESDARAAKEVFGELVKSGVEGSSAEVTYGIQQNIEGSIYIQQGQDKVRFRWRGGASAQDVYLNGEETYFGCNQDQSVTAYRTGGSSTGSIVQESEARLQKRAEYQDRQNKRQYEADLEEYNSGMQVAGRLIGGLLGRTYSAPQEPDPVTAENPSLVADDLEITPERQQEVIEAVEATTRVLNAGAEALEERFQQLKSGEVAKADLR